MALGPCRERRRHARRAPHEFGDVFAYSAIPKESGDLMTAVLAAAESIGAKLAPQKARYTSHNKRPPPKKKKRAPGDNGSNVAI